MQLNRDLFVKRRGSAQERAGVQESTGEHTGAQERARRREVAAAERGRGGCWNWRIGEGGNRGGSKIYECIAVQLKLGTKFR